MRKWLRAHAHWASQIFWLAGGTSIATNLVPHDQVRFPTNLVVCLIGAATIALGAVLNYYFPEKR